MREVNSLYFSLLLVLCGMAAGLTREYIYIKKSEKWNNAQTYCRRNYKDLATITTKEEQQRLIKAVGNSTVNGWIGLKRTAPGSKTWEWSDGELPFFFNWRKTQPDNAGSLENCVSTYSSGWNDYVCSKRLPFYCYRSFTLVKENKTWVDALEYCRRNNTVLACQTSATQLLLTEMEAAHAQTVSIWTGLRFLDGKWFWVNRVPQIIPISLPSCPARNYRCGTRNTQIHIWENRDCNEKLNFICY